jgi:hypothetical protein
VLANPTHGSKLPTSMRTLYELSTLPVKLLEAKISDGTITPDIERRDVKQLKRKESSDDKVEVDGRTVERNLSRTEQLKIAKTKITTLEAKLKGGGSLFDLKADTVEDIAAVIVANIHESKAVALAKAIPEAIKELKRKRQKPAG